MARPPTLATWVSLAGGITLGALLGAANGAALHFAELADGSLSRIWRGSRSSALHCF